MRFVKRHEDGGNLKGGYGEEEKRCRKGLGPHSSTGAEGLALRRRIDDRIVDTDKIAPQ